jgi:hypothetical protein
MAKVVKTCVVFMVPFIAKIAVVIVCLPISKIRMSLLPLTMLIAFNTIKFSAHMPRQKTIPALVGRSNQTTYTIRVIIGMMGRFKVAALTAGRIVIGSSQAIVATVGTLVWIPGGLTQFKVGPCYAQHIMALGITATLGHPVEITTSQVLSGFAGTCVVYDRHNTSTQSKGSGGTLVGMAPHATVHQKSRMWRAVPRGKLSCCHLTITLAVVHGVATIASARHLGSGKAGKNDKHGCNKDRNGYG